VSALYRQARPTTFDEMVGQEHVKEVLMNALRQGKLAQAYLFSGPRGVGKTSSARLIAQAVNCNQDPKPCGVCEGCRLVREGRHPDVLEIDAASNNSVEDVRDLRERILLAPILGRHKVVILDEAHMMSKSAFNALLKTLEEPPPHVIFIFATTEPERMPPTILSRTQHFRFRRLSEAEIVEKLERILAGLGREAEPQALGLVARLADGAMRDAESLLDRLLTLEGPLTLKQTEDALGLPPQEALFALAEALDQGQLRRALEQAHHLYTQGFAARTLAQGLLEALRAGLYGRMGLGRSPSGQAGAHTPGGTGPHLNQPEERLVAAMTALDEAQERLLKRSDALSLELAVLSASQALHAAPTAPATPASTPTIPEFDPRPRRLEGRVARPLEREEAPASPSPTPQSVADLAAEWRRVMGALKTTIRAFVREAEPRFEEDRLVLLFAEQKSFHHQGAQKHLGDIQKAVQEVLGIPQVELRLGGKKKPVDEPSARPSRPTAPERARSPAASAESVPLPAPAQPPLPPEDDSSPAAARGPAPAEAIQEAPSLAQEAPSLAHEPPEPEPWNPEASLFDPLAPDEAAEEAEAKPSLEASLLEDPRFQKLVQLFGGRLRKFYPEAPREAALEATPSDLEGEAD
jgi:DNA polymerase-3 subunit gamma/tau